MLGWWKFKYANGEFDIALRPLDVFYCPQYPAQAKWMREGDDSVLIDWGKFGKYEMTIVSPTELEGHALGKPANWRKASFVREFTPEEMLLQNGGTEWMFEWRGGAFPVEFRADGMNHFNCPSFPGHSHWTQDGNKICISWDKYGEYELEVDASTNTMVGCKKGDPDNWRRATLIRNMGAEGLQGVHDHEHSHKHGEACSGHH